MAYGPTPTRVVGFFSGGRQANSQMEPRGDAHERQIQVADVPHRHVPVDAGQLEPRADGRPPLELGPDRQPTDPLGRVSRTLERSSAQMTALRFPDGVGP